MSSIHSLLQVRYPRTTPPQHLPSPNLASPHLHTPLPDLSPRERALRCAIAALQSGTFLSERRCASAYNIPRSTLRDRLSGRVVARSEAHTDRQRLTPQQETLLCYWILQAGWFGVPPTRERVREMAARLLENSGEGRGGNGEKEGGGGKEGWSGKPLGKVWVKGFLKRNPRVGGVVV